MADMHIRKATPEDADQLADLAHELNLFHQDDTRPAPELLRKHQANYEAFVAESVNGKLAGYAAGYNTFQFHTATPGFEIQNMAVAAKFRRKGVGRGLIQRLITEKYNLGVRKFTLGVDNDNVSARAFYKAMGFTERDFGSAKRCYLRDDDLDRFLEAHAPSNPT